MIVCFARMGGHTVGIIANQPKFFAGVLDVNAADKATRFIRFCDAFNIPLVTLADVPGYLPGKTQEWNGIIRHGAKLLWCYSEATVPKITVVTRKAYGGSYLAMCSRDLGADALLAWPTAEIAVMGATGAASIIFRKQIQEASNPAAMREKKINEYRGLFSNPYIKAARGLVDAVIAPRETRRWIIRALEMLKAKREMRPQRKHGNIPV
jgi:acetyl-CoA carboxylase carboxyltransferase component